MATTATGIKTNEDSDNSIAENENVV